MELLVLEYVWGMKRIAVPAVVFMQKIPVPGALVKALMFVRISLMQHFALSPVHYLSRFLFLPRHQMTSSKLRTHKN